MRFYFFSYWTKVLPGAAQGEVNQVTVGVIGVNRISVTKHMELFLLDGEWLSSCSAASQESGMPTFFLKHSGFLLGSWVQQTHPLLSCSTEKEGTLLAFLRELELKEIVL